MLYTAHGQPLRLGRQLGAGGAGTVYEIADQPQLVAKRFHRPLTAAHIAKLEALIALGDERLSQLAAWPVDLLRAQPNGDIVGYLMPRVGQAEELHTLHSPKSRLQKFPEATWEFLLYVAANTARAVATIHERGFIIGDINPKNILVTRKATVHWLDCDSFQVTTATGQTLRCEQGFPEYTPPELHGVAFRDIDRTPQHDAFGLAVVIFQLLFLGRHPFAGKFLGEGDMSLQRAIAEGRLAYDEAAASRQMQTPPGTLPWQAISPELRELFQRAFLTAARPAAVDWLAPLAAMTQSLHRCVTHDGHRYAAHVTECPWCAIEARTTRRLFNLTLSPTAAEHFNLEAFWREIESVAPPAAVVEPDYIAPLHLNPISFPYDFAVERFKEKRLRYFGLTTGLAVLTGFFLAALPFWLMLFGVRFAIWLLQSLMRPEAIQSLPEQLTDWAVPADETLEARIDAYRLERTRRLHAAEASWQDEATGARFQFERDKLERMRTQLENWQQVRVDRVRECERTERAQLPQPALSARWPVSPADSSQTRLAARLAVERDLETDRLALERELTMGRSTLQRIRRDTEAQRERLLKILREARHELWQADTATEVVSSRYSAVPQVVMFLCALVLGCVLRLDPFANMPAPRTGNSPATERSDPPLPKRDKPFINDGPRMARSAEDAEQALKLYGEAKALSRQGKHQQALPQLTEAIRLAPNLGAAYDELGLAHYKLERYDEALKIIQPALPFNDTYESQRLLGMIYAAREEWRASQEHFIQALRNKEKKGKVWPYEEVEFFYQLGQALRGNGSLPAEIKTLEADRARGTFTPVDHFQLGCYYLWSGDEAGVKRTEKALRKLDAQLVEHFFILKVEHSVRTSKG